MNFCELMLIINWITCSFFRLVVWIWILLRIQKSNKTYNKSPYPVLKWANKKEMPMITKAFFSLIWFTTDFYLNGCTFAASCGIKLFRAFNTAEATFVVTSNSRDATFSFEYFSRTSRASQFVPIFPRNCFNVHPSLIIWLLSMSKFGCVAVLAINLDLKKFRSKYFIHE